MLNGILSPALLVLIMLAANHPDILGDQVNGPWSNLLGWFTTAAMAACAVGLAFTWRS